MIDLHLVSFLFGAIFGGLVTDVILLALLLYRATRPEPEQEQDDLGL